MKIVRKGLPICRHLFCITFVYVVLVLEIHGLIGFLDKNLKFCFQPTEIHFPGFEDNEAAAGRDDNSKIEHEYELSNGSPHVYGHVSHVRKHLKTLVRQIFLKHSFSIISMAIWVWFLFLTDINRKDNFRKLNS